MKPAAEIVDLLLDGLAHLEENKIHSDLARLKAIDCGAEAERDPATWLN